MMMIVIKILHLIPHLILQCQKTNNNKKKQRKKPLISFQYHPGFFCFFQSYVKKQDWTYYECYKKIFQSHHQMMKIRNPIKDIVANKQLDKVQIINELMYRSQKGKKFAYYKEKQNGQLQCNVITHEDRRIEKIQNLKKQLVKLEKIKENVIEKKKIEFKKKQLQRIKDLEKQAQNLIKEKQRRANLVKQIQQQADQMKKQKKLKLMNNPNTSSCQIM